MSQSVISLLSPLLADHTAAGQGKQNKQLGGEQSQKSSTGIGHRRTGETFQGDGAAAGVGHG